MAFFLDELARVPFEHWILFALVVVAGRIDYWITKRVKDSIPAGEFNKLELNPLVRKLGLERFRWIPSVFQAIVILAVFGIGGSVFVWFLAGLYIALLWVNFSSYYRLKIMGTEGLRLFFQGPVRYRLGMRLSSLIFAAPVGLLLFVLPGLSLQWFLLLTGILVLVLFGTFSEALSVVRRHAVVDRKVPLEVRLGDEQKRHEQEKEARFKLDLRRLEFQAELDARKAFLEAKKEGMVEAARERGRRAARPRLQKLRDGFAKFQVTRNSGWTGEGLRQLAEANFSQRPMNTGFNEIFGLKNLHEIDFWQVTVGKAKERSKAKTRGIDRVC